MEPYSTMEKGRKYKFFLPLVFALILSLSLFLNSTGAGFGLPSFPEWDESYLAGPALHMLKTGDLNPHWFVYPGLCMYMMLVVFVFAFTFLVLLGKWPAAAQDIRLLSRYNWPPFFVAGRLFIAFMGTMTVAVTYAVGKKFFSKRAALIGSFTLAIAPLLVEQSHFILPNVPETFFILCGMYYSLRIVDEPDNGAHIIMAGVLSGFATAAKYTAAPIALAAILAIALSTARTRRTRPLALASFSLFYVVAFFVTNPFAIMNLPLFLNQLGDTISRHSKYDQTASLMNSPIHTALWFIWYSIPCYMGRIACVLAVFGLVLSLKRLDKKRAVVGFFVLFYFVFLSLINTKRHRYGLPLYPFLALYCGHSIDALLQFVSRAMVPRGNANAPYKKVGVFFVGACVLSLVAYEPFTESWMLDSRKFSKPYIRNIAWDWIQENIPQKSSIVLQAWDGRAFEEGGLSDTVPVNPSMYRLSPIYPVRPITWLDLVDIDFVVAYAPEQADQVKDMLTLLKEFDARALDAVGPNVLIWRVSSSLSKSNPDLVKIVYADGLICVGEGLNASYGPTLGGRAALFYSNASKTHIDISLDPGNYTLHFNACADLYKDICPIARVEVDGKKVGEVLITSPQWTYYSLDFMIDKKGPHTVLFSFINDYYVPGAADINFYISRVLVMKNRMRHAT
jgi:hypothetical protein